MFSAIAIFTLPLPIAASFPRPGWGGIFSNSGTVTNTTQAAVSTGGQEITGGGSIKTGSSFASVNTVTIINGGGNGGSFNAEVTTVHGSATSTESVHKTLMAGEDVFIDTATSSGGVNNNVRVSVRVLAGDAASSILGRASTSVNSKISSSTAPKVAVHGWFAQLLQRLSDWFSFF